MTQGDDELFPQVELRSYAELLAARLRGATRRLDIDWAAVGDDLGAALPGPHRALAELLPSGHLGRGIWWLSPVAPLVGARLDFAQLRLWQELMTGVSPIPLHPQMPGYLIFAQTSASIDWAYEVGLDEEGRRVCASEVCLIDWDHGVVEKTGLDVHELLYRSITNKPRLTGRAARLMHPLFFSDPSFPLFRSSVNGE